VPAALLLARGLGRPDRLRLPRGVLPRPRRQRALQGVRGQLLLSRRPRAAPPALPRQRRVHRRRDARGDVPVHSGLRGGGRQPALRVRRLPRRHDQGRRRQRRVHALRRRRVQRLRARVRGVSRAHAVGGGLREPGRLRLRAGGVSTGLRAAAFCQDVSSLYLPGRGEPDQLQGLSRQHLPVRLRSNAGGGLRRLSSALGHPACRAGGGAEQLHLRRRLQRAGRRAVRAVRGGIF
jgi:hypothetical protein